MSHIAITYRNKTLDFVAELSKPDFKHNSEILYEYYTKNPDDIMGVFSEYLTEEQPVPVGTYYIKSISLVDNSDFEKTLFSHNLNMYVHWDCKNLEKITNKKEPVETNDICSKFGSLYPFGF